MAITVLCANRCQHPKKFWLVKTTFDNFSDNILSISVWANQGIDKKLVEGGVEGTYGRIYLQVCGDWSKKTHIKIQEGKLRTRLSFKRKGTLFKCLVVLALER